MSLPASSELAVLNLQPSDSDSFPANMNAATNQQEPVKYLHIHDFIPLKKDSLHFHMCSFSELTIWFVQEQAAEQTVALKVGQRSEF